MRLQRPSHCSCPRSGTRTGARTTAHGGRCAICCNGQAELRGRACGLAPARARAAAPAVAREPGSAQAPPAAVLPRRQAALSRVLDAALAATQLRRLEAANALEAVAAWRSGASKGAMGSGALPSTDPAETMSPPEFRETLRRHLGVERPAPRCGAAQGGARDVQRQSSQGSYNLAQRVAFWRRRTSLALQRALTRVVIDNWNAVIAPDGDVSAYRRIALLQVPRPSPASAEPPAPPSSVMHLRLGDVWARRPHKRYGQPPLSWYTAVLQHRAWRSVVLVTEPRRRRRTATKGGQNAANAPRLDGASQLTLDHLSV
ncbi:hypothetical protein JKP88DRAFT_290443 [Tribonema minus]|uniref:Uncharacterized protein n=1 Tax=Tribonema minus TaxID=303371 RepID=A0A835Z534_9STRA|nr:hypothetical protein JKP88DRAFT_290443 [Tribonema minus]